MLSLIWLLLMAICGWTAVETVGGKGQGRISDLLLGITGGLAVRFLFEALRIDVDVVNLLLFSVWGAAALPGIVKFLLKRRRNRKAGDVAREGPEFPKGPGILQAPVPLHPSPRTGFRRGPAIPRIVSCIDQQRLTPLEHT